jgi:hypothetical protein
MNINLEQIILSGKETHPVAFLIYP